MQAKVLPLFIPLQERLAREHQVARWFTRQEASSDCAAKWNDLFAFTPCGKNKGKSMIPCRCLYAQHNLALYDDQIQFEIIVELDIDGEAKHTALHMPQDRAKEASVDSFWKSGKGTPPPPAR